jgi:hypothetical protein
VNNSIVEVMGFLDIIHHSDSFKTWDFRDWNLSPSSGKIYFVQPNWYSYSLSPDTTGSTSQDT